MRHEFKKKTGRNLIQTFRWLGRRIQEWKCPLTGVVSSLWTYCRTKNKSGRYTFAVYAPFVCILNEWIFWIKGSGVMYVIPNEVIHKEWSKRGKPTRLTFVVDTNDHSCPTYGLDLRRYLA